MSLAPGLVKTPFLESTGTVSVPWLRFLEDLGTSTATGSSSPDTALIARVAALEALSILVVRRLADLEMGYQL